VAEAGVVGIAFQLAQVFQVVEPAFADFFRIKGGQAGVAEGNPAAGGNAVGDVGDFAGVKLVEVFQGGLLQQFGVGGGGPFFFFSLNF